jgi:YfiH family protein
VEALERAGLTVAAMSGLDDGDCSSRPDATASRNAFLAKCGIFPARLARVRQVHGTTIHTVDEAFLHLYPGDTPDYWPAGDGLVTNVPGIALGVSVADCVPLWIFDPVRRVLGLFHAGREGTVAEIAAIGVHAMMTGFGCLPADLLAVIGPSAGPCCYELSETMAEELKGRGFPVSERNFDLWETNRRQLSQAGVDANRILITGQCTLCGPSFHSYRKSGTFARNLAVTMM